MLGLLNCHRIEIFAEIHVKITLFCMNEIIFLVHSKMHVEKYMVSMASANNENDTNNDKIIAIADGQLN